MVDEYLDEKRYKINLKYVDLKNVMNPCDRCNSEVLEASNIRFSIIESKKYNKITSYYEIPFYCKCIDDLFSEKQLSMLITNLVITRFLQPYNEEEFRRVLDKYYIFVDIEFIYMELMILKLNLEHFPAEIEKAHKIIKLYKEYANVNLKLAKR
jgi:hypothetical protein